MAFADSGNVVSNDVLRVVSFGASKRDLARHSVAAASGAGQVVCFNWTMLSWL